MPLGRLQVLPDGQEVDVGGAQVVHHLQYFGAFLGEPDHDAGFGKNQGIQVLGPIEDAQRMEIPRPRANARVEPGHGLEVVVEDVGAGGDHRLQGAVFVAEIGGEHLDGGRRRGFADALDAAHELAGAAVLQVVAVDRGDDHVPEAHLGHGDGQVFRLQGIDRVGLARLDVAKRAGPRAGVAEDHHRRMTAFPAFADVRTRCLLANRMQVVAAHEAPGFAVRLRGRRLDADPRRLAQPRLPALR